MCVCIYLNIYDGGHVFLARLLGLVVAVAHTREKHRNNTDISGTRLRSRRAFCVLWWWRVLKRKAELYDIYIYMYIYICIYIYIYVCVCVCVCVCISKYI